MYLRFVTWLISNDRNFPARIYSYVAGKVYVYPTIMFIS